MISDLDQLAAWSVQNAVRRLDSLNRDFGTVAWDGGSGRYPSAPELSQGSSAHGANATEFEYWGQDPETKELRLRPILVYPGLVVAPWAVKPAVPPSGRYLWLMMKYVPEYAYIGRGHYPFSGGVADDSTVWSGKMSADAWLEWSERENREDEEKGFFSLDGGRPPEIRRVRRVGRTDDDGTFHDTGAMDDAAGMYFPTRMTANDE